MIALTENTPLQSKIPCTFPLDSKMQILCRSIFNIPLGRENVKVFLTFNYPYWRDLLVFYGGEKYSGKEAKEVLRN